MGKEEAKAKVAELVEKLKRYEKEGKLAGMNEANTKTGFIEPLFEALGWNMRNFEEVKLEEGVSNRKRADYAFRLGGSVRFYLEAKAISVSLEEKEAWQAIKYAYYKSVPWAVLTNFRQLIVYSSEWKSEKAEDCRFLKFGFEEFVSRFDELWLLGKEAVSSDGLGKEAGRVGRKPKNEPVTKALFADFMRWRDMLSKDVAKHDPREKLTKEDIDEGVQRFLNRLIFIRTCEDRKLENERLRAVLREWKGDKKWRLTSHLRNLRDEFNDVYDSDIFFPHMAGEILIDDETLEKVINALYGYDFSAIDADVLGCIYEQYLAHILRRGGGLLEREAKRKEMGIYYTPTYIVRYIVENTLGELLKNAKTHADIEKISVLDPACGSGSFLIRAYDVLNEAYAKANGGDHQTLGENISRNANAILTKNIHGVDLDKKAIDIVYLNLMLKAAQVRGMLPMISDTVKCGNSLISGTKEEMEKWFGGNWREKRPLNWEETFSEVMKNGGFDVVVGNPPYGAEFDDNEKKYFRKTYQTVSRVMDSYILFIEQMTKLIKKDGMVGVIVPESWLANPSNSNLREYLLKNFCIVQIVDLPGMIFPQATVDTILLILRKSPPNKNKISVRFVGVNGEMTIIKENLVPQSRYLMLEDYNMNTRLDEKTFKILDNIEKISIKLKDICKNSRGIETGDNEKYISSKKEGDAYLPIITGDDIGKYAEPETRYFVRYGKWLSNPKTKDIFKGNKIILQRIKNQNLKVRLVATIDTGGRLILDSVHMLYAIDVDYHVHYILGLLNSSLLNFYFKLFSLYPRINSEDLERLPIKNILPSEQAPIISLVERMLELNKQLVEMEDKQNTERREIETEIARTDAKIDELVYKLYGITEEERKIIEESFKS